jgi:integrase
MAGKQGNGEGTIRKRADGRWEARIVLENGTRKSLYAKTRQEASRVLADARRDREQGITASTERQTVEQYLTSWVDAVKLHTTEPSSYVRTRYDVRSCIIPCLGRHQLTKLTAQQVQAFYAEKLQEGYATASVRHMHTTLRDALQNALKLGLVYRNVADMVEPPRIQQAEMAVLTEDQARLLLDTVAGDRLEVLVVLALATGMREGELIALRWGDVDFGSGVVQVNRTLKQTPQGRQIGKAKSKRSRRPIALPASVAAALRGHRVRQLDERLRLGEAWQENDLVFCDEIGRRLSPSRFNALGWFGRVVRQSGVPTIRFHDLRHTAATLLLARGVNVKVVSEMLGHATISITLSLYGHVLPHMQREAAATMDEVLGL